MESNPARKRETTRSEHLLPGPRVILDFLLVAAGGALGGVARFWLSGAVARRVGERFPWGTLAVNVSGAFVLGISGSVLGATGLAVPEAHAWLLLAVGVLGSYTTVSSFSLQTLELARGGELGRAASNVLLSFGACVAAAAAGWSGGGLVLGV